MSKKLTTAEFVRRAKKIHGMKYDYSRVHYTKYENKVTIGCSKHGWFKQTANGHLNGNGCRKCTATAALDTAEFIRRALRVHGDRYDYSKAEYKNKDTKVKIHCPIEGHGGFSQTPRNHVCGGTGCPKCFGNNKPSTAEFIAKAKTVHKTQHYNYSKT